MNSSCYNVAIVGATGAVGLEIIACLSKCQFPIKQIFPFSSAKSAGKLLDSDYGQLVTEEYSLEKVRSCDLVFLAVSGDFALANAPQIVENNGPVVIDNSSAFRYQSGIPLVVNYTFVYMGINLSLLFSIA